MPRTASVQRAAARIRRLACLDAGGPHFAPLLLQELAGVLAFDGAGYAYFGTQGESAFYSDAPDVVAMLPFYLSEPMQAAEREVARPLAVAARSDMGPQLREQLMTVPEAAFQKSDYHNLLLRPLAIDDCVSLVPRQPGAAPSGAFKFYRRGRCTRFGRADVAVLAELEPFLARMLQPRAASSPHEREVPQGRALLVATPEGRVLWRSEGAEALWRLAFGEPPGSEPPPRCAEVLQRWRRVRDGAAQAQLPSLAWNDANGSFVLAASTLGSAAGVEPAVALELEHRQDPRVLLLQRLRELALPERQFEIAYRLVRGEAEPALAARLGISLNTLVYHRRRLYERLAVHSRQELQARLAPLASQPQAPLL